MTGFVCGHCGHTWRHHTGKGGVGDCRTVTIGGPATPAAYLGAAAELHMGRTITRCDCTRYSPAPGSTGANNQEKEEAK